VFKDLMHWQAYLTATFAYYVNIILGLDYDLLALKGAMYFSKGTKHSEQCPEN
jgi:hypothetical protein